MTSLLGHPYRFARSVASAYGRHAGSQLAAAIAYRVLFSLVPFVALVLSVLDLVLPDDARSRFAEWLFGSLPGAELEESVDRSLAESGAAAPLVGLVAVATLLWAASGMTASIRTAFRVIWEVEAGPAYVRAKLRDFAFVAGAGILLVGAFVLSAVAQVVVEAGEDLSDELGATGAWGPIVAVSEVASSGVLGFVALLALYRLVPPVRMRFRDLWPSALLAAVAVQVALAGFAFYLANIADFHSVYGPFGAVLAFLLLVYILAVIVLLGAELAAGRGGRGAAPPSRVTSRGTA